MQHLDHGEMRVVVLHKLLLLLLAYSWSVCAQNQDIYAFLSPGRNTSCPPPFATPEFALFDILLNSGNAPLGVWW